MNELQVIINHEIKVKTKQNKKNTYIVEKVLNFLLLQRVRERERERDLFIHSLWLS